MCGLVGADRSGGTLGLAQQDVGAEDLRKRLFGRLFDALRDRQEERQAAEQALLEPFAPRDVNLRPNLDLVSEVGVNPVVAARQRRQRTLGISQLGVPLPGRLSGGLHLPD